MLAEYKDIIEQVWENRSLLEKDSTKKTIRDIIELLDKGKIRVAEPTDKGWKVNEWIKKAVILYFPIQKMEVTKVGP
ncbi:MAG: 2,3,4,5-tetrahydropyridine-2,6-dicarboxylate N-succinyltransferase, partial [Bacteroidales bacterium]|nr:2,3,4,5-tetrahydropyridine-2,6-dicarboxylate N-succinyltransferase [Bacteroidales bacterium]